MKETLEFLPRNNVGCLYHVSKMSPSQHCGQQNAQSWNTCTLTQVSCEICRALQVPGKKPTPEHVQKFDAHFPSGFRFPMLTNPCESCSLTLRSGWESKRLPSRLRFLVSVRQSISILYPPPRLCPMSPGVSSDF